LLCFCKAVVGWLLLMIVGMNFLGLVVRGLIRTPEAQDLDARITDPAVRAFMTQHKSSNAGFTLFCAVMGMLYLYALSRFWNIGVAAAAVMAMLARLPDLVWEIRTGRKITPESGPKGIPGLLGHLFMWGALPVLWFALCRR
jgi:hypothetical protein